MADLVTGDAVPLDLRVAGLPSRALGLALDLAVQLLLLAILLILVAWVFPVDSGGSAALMILSVVGALVLWPAGLEVLTGGRSLGKLALGLRVVRDDGGPVRFRHCLMRALAMVFLDLWTTSGAVGGLSVLLSQRAKRMGDHLAGTIVVGERLPRALAAGMTPVAMPPPLAGWASQLDLVAVPDQLALSVRTFLNRAPSMEPQARAATSWRLAAQVASLVRQPAPSGTPAEAYLAAIVAERSRRASWPGGRVAGPGMPGHRPVGTWAATAPQVPPPGAPPPGTPPPSGAPPPSGPGQPVAGSPPGSSAPTSPGFAPPT